MSTGTIGDLSADADDYTILEQSRIQQKKQQERLDKIAAREGSKVYKNNRELAKHLCPVKDCTEDEDIIFHWLNAIGTDELPSIPIDLQRWYKVHLDLDPIEARADYLLHKGLLRKTLLKKDNEEVAYIENSVVREKSLAAEKRALEAQIVAIEDKRTAIASNMVAKESKNDHLRRAREAYESGDWIPPVERRQNAYDAKGGGY